MTTNKQNLIKALDHEEPDFLPIDLGGTAANTIMVGPYVKLCSHFGIDPNPLYLAHPEKQNLNLHNYRLREKLGCNTNALCVFRGSSDWYQRPAYEGTMSYVPTKFVPEEQPDGSEIIMNYKTPLKKPKDGFFFDLTDHALKNITSLDGLGKFEEAIAGYDKYPWHDAPVEQEMEYIKKLNPNDEYFLVGALIYHIFEGGQVLRGWSDFLLDLAMRPSFAEGLMDKIVEGHLKDYEEYSQTVGKHVNAIFVADDMGMQNTTWIRPDMYRKNIKPYHAKLFRAIKKSGKRLILHSCGAVRELIPDFIEMGVDVLNPVQYSAAGMELKQIKKDFGKDISFWGGGIDTQTVLNSGTPEKVRDEVKRNIDIMADGGGFVFTQVHNVIEGCPIENVIAAYETAAVYGRK